MILWGCEGGRFSKIKSSFFCVLKIDHARRNEITAPNVKTPACRMRSFLALTAPAIKTEKNTSKKLTL
jgi:hypothetical protein